MDIKLESPEKLIKNEEYRVFSNKTVICVLTTITGFTIIGEAHAHNPLGFDENIGRERAKSDALDKLYELESYRQHFDAQYDYDCEKRQKEEEEAYDKLSKELSSLKDLIGMAAEMESRIAKAKEGEHEEDIAKYTQPEPLNEDVNESLDQAMENLERGLKSMGFEVLQRPKKEPAGNFGIGIVRYGRNNAEAAEVSEIYDWIDKLNSGIFGK